MDLYGPFDSLQPQFHERVGGFRRIGHIYPSRCQQAIIGQPQLATNGVGLSYSTRSLLNVSVIAGGFAGVTG